jgi:hypothetical protein
MMGFMTTAKRSSPARRRRLALARLRSDGATRAHGRPIVRRMAPPVSELVDAADR